MKKLLTFAALVAVTLTGCMSGSAKRFFPENKNVVFEDATLTIATPWGTQTISAKRIESIVVYQYGATNQVAIIAPKGSHVVNPHAPIQP